MLLGGLCGLSLTRYFKVGVLKSFYLGCSIGTIINTGIYISETFDRF